MNKTKENENTKLAVVLHNITIESHHRFYLGASLAVYKDIYPDKFKTIADFFQYVRGTREEKIL